VPALQTAGSAARGSLRLSRTRLAQHEGATFSSGKPLAKLTPCLPISLDITTHHIIPYAFSPAKVTYRWLQYKKQINNYLQKKTHGRDKYFFFFFFFFGFLLKKKIRRDREEEKRREKEGEEEQKKKSQESHSQ
jgi:hypothetical protein